MMNKIKKREKNSVLNVNVNVKCLKFNNLCNGKLLRLFVGKLKNLFVLNGNKWCVLLWRNKFDEMWRRWNGLGWRRKKG